MFKDVYCLEAWLHDLMVLPCLSLLFLIFYFLLYSLSLTFCQFLSLLFVLPFSFSCHIFLLSCHLCASVLTSCLHQDTNFLGREALLQQRQDGVFRRFVMLVLEDHDTELDLWPWWGEPIYRNGQLAGTTTSSAYSYTLERHVCLGFVSPPPGKEGLPTPITPDFINRGDYEVDIAGQRYPAKAKLYPFSSLFTQQKRRKEDMELSNLQGK